jgi:hypothetical protein
MAIKRNAPGGHHEAFTNLRTGAASRSTVAVYHTISLAPASIPKALLVALLIACFERLPALAMALGRGVLWCWPGMRRA